jgi:hypothetical protein
MPAEARSRLEQLLSAARRLADPLDALGREARAVLPASTRLSLAGVELALSRSLETQPTPGELDKLASCVSPSARSHVVLSANVFTAAHRAIALALAASKSVFVKASRREPHFPRLLSAAAPGLFELVDSLAAGPGDQVFAYGTDNTLATFQRELPAGTRLHAHGPGFGAVFIQNQATARVRFESLAAALSLDVAVFDQRGCLSPRLVVFEGSTAAASDFSRVLADALEHRETELPLGELDDEERAELARQRLALTYAGSVEPAGSGFVAQLEDPAAELPLLGGRSVIVLRVANAVERARLLSADVTTYSAAGSDAFVHELGAALPRARAAAFGALQTPPFDGPVDLRTTPLEVGAAAR